LRINEVLLVVALCLLSACGSKGSEQTENSQNIQGQDIQTQNTQAQNIEISIEQPANKADAARFLYRATFGPTETDMQQLINNGYESWLDDQFEQVPNYQLKQLNQLLIETGYENTYDFNENKQRRMLRSDVWWNTVVNGNDQLRQRVAFALSQIFVISEKDSALRNKVRGLASYTDLLIEYAFGNFRELLEAITLHPMMGSFLSMNCNQKANTMGTIQPDENYAREVMQLFTTGLKQLNLNGTEILDENNQPLDTYKQNEILAFARVFTGWSYGNTDEFCAKNKDPERDILPMKAFDAFHDKGEKILLNGEVLPGNQTARQDLQMALDNLFNHSNVAPFISKQLIQRLVTSNPSPNYVERVAKIFNDNGQGIKGDLKAVVKAILMDTEAFRGHIDNPYHFGKLKEPMIKLINIWRAFQAEGINGRLRYYDSLGDIGQQHLSAPSVFNFFLPEYSQPGELSRLNLASPEFQIFDESTAVSTQNRLARYIHDIKNENQNERGEKNRVILNFDTLKSLAAEPDKLVEKLNELLLAGRMSDPMRDILTSFVNKTSFNDDGSLRVKEVLFLVAISPEFAYQR